MALPGFALHCAISTLVKPNHRAKESGISRVACPSPTFRDAVQVL